MSSNDAGELVRVTAVAPDADGLRGLVRQLAGLGEPVAAATWVDERRAVGPRPARAGRVGVQIADAQKVKGLAPLACKTDRIDAWVLAELSRLGCPSRGRAPPPPPRCA